MKIQVVKNTKGEVIAAFKRTPRELVSVEVDISEEEEMEEIDIPDEYIGLPAPDFVKWLQAHIQAKPRR